MRELQVIIKEHNELDTMGHVRLTIDPTRITIKFRIRPEEEFRVKCVEAALKIASQIPEDYPRTLRGDLGPEGTLKLFGGTKKNKKVLMTFVNGKAVID